MIIRVKKSTLTEGIRLIRRSGYAMERARETGEISFAKRVHGTRFPRFHVYLEERGEDALIKLHLDQKEPSYAGATAHAGEYEGKAVEEEIKRISGFIEQATKNIVSIL